MSPDAAFKPVSIYVGFLLPYSLASTILRQKKTAKRIICEITGIISNACSYIIQGNKVIFSLKLAITLQKRNFDGKHQKNAPKK